ncbi:MAG TPA: c-type cytochrome [Verrucomicrobiota bacterium]|nr:c-type cytochrome [Verrucomicrobiota bacterium]HNT14361.1 c-type cytochrome [Verrucomicrobiota bacterium]
MMRLLLFAVAILIGVFLAGGVDQRATPLKIDLPPETTAFKPAPGAELVNGQCLVCHSVEYVSSQPPMPRPFWSAAVKKMVDKYGANVPPDQIDPIVDYLYHNYGDAPPPTTAPAAPAPAAPSTDPVQLGTKYGCLACHNPTMKIIGPALREVARKYQADPEAAQKIAHQIRHGGSGQWGSIIMPPFPQISDGEIQTLTDWILRQK